MNSSYLMFAAWFFLTVALALNFIQDGRKKTNEIVSTLSPNRIHEDKDGGIGIGTPPLYGDLVIHANGGVEPLVTISQSGKVTFCKGCNPNQAEFWRKIFRIQNDFLRQTEPRADNRITM